MSGGRGDRGRAEAARRDRSTQEAHTGRLVEEVLAAPFAGQFAHNNEIERIIQIIHYFIYFLFVSARV